ncbi:MAG: UDP-N-acetylmuramoyl-L-alanine--D-glutamate ligase [Thiogranum sp.]|nr:UDP-N-acetylmuramoyl-L-alanine--D-glutamate ligase [Thiogranum sp.]
MLAAADTMEMDSSHAIRTLIVGLGATGLSCARYLVRQGVEVAVTDSRAQPPGLADIQTELPDVALFLGGFDPQAFARAERIVVSPGVDLREPVLVEARSRGVEIIGDIELFARAAIAPVIAITGSNGKSTVTTLVGAMARRGGMDVRVGGNLGTPALALLQDHEPDLYVLELSSFQLDLVQSLFCRAATVLNVSPDHLDRYDSLEDYAQSKRQIFTHAELQVINRDDATVTTLLQPGNAVVSFGLNAPDGENFGVRELDGQRWVVKGEERWLPVTQIRMPGLHNLANALAALALGEAAGIERSAMLQTLREFQGLPHRTQWVAQCHGVSWFNDSKATNVGAALAAVNGFEGPLILIAGGQAKGADFSQLADGLDRRVKALVLLGEAAAEIEQALQGRFPVQHARSMTEAVKQCASLADAGDTVLLSPACASFDMFNGYAHRGELFMQAVQEYCA